jgi:hypothetical protein
MGRLIKLDKPEELPDSKKCFFAFGEKAGNDCCIEIIFFYNESGLHFLGFILFTT